MVDIGEVYAINGEWEDEGCEDLFTAKELSTVKH